MGLVPSLKLNCRPILILCLLHPLISGTFMIFSLISTLFRISTTLKITIYLNQILSISTFDYTNTTTVCSLLLSLFSVFCQILLVLLYDQRRYLFLGLRIGTFLFFYLPSSVIFCHMLLAYVP